MKLQTVLLAAGVAIGVGSSAWAAQPYFTFAPGESVGYIDDPARWSSGDARDHHCVQSGTILVTNGVKTAYWQFDYGSDDPAKPTVVRVLSGGVVGNDFRPGFKGYGVLDVEEGGAIDGCVNPGDQGGCGIVTNRGALTIRSGALQLGLEAGSVGTYVHAGSANSFANPFNLHVGCAGRGELIVAEEKEFWWRYYRHGNGDVIVGRSQEDNRIIVNNNAKFRAGYVYLGGNTAGGAGRGELLLRGGIYSSTQGNSGKDDLIWLGSCPNSEGGVDPNSFGRIRGWGYFTGDSVHQTGNNSVCIRLGYGEIVGDGEGDESHVLKCNNGICQVANVLAGIVTTSGWRAVNKGAVCLPGYTAADGNDFSLTACVGCTKTLEKPDLVNSIRMAATDLARGKAKHFGVQVLAADRTDAHVNSLPVGANVLSVWKVGVFEGYGDNVTPSQTGGAIIDFRYDQTKLTKTTTQIELLRYEEATGRWTRLNRIKPDARPDDCIISTPTAVARVDETYNLGTFAVIESEVKGLFIVVK